MCDTLVSLAPSTTRGATLFAKNSDRERNEAQGLELSPARSGPAGAPLRLPYITLPDVARTHACLLSRPFWMWGAEMGANDRGVVIGNEALHARVPAQRRRALTGMDLVRLGLERGGTAREALEVIVGLLEAHGQGGDCGHLGRLYYHNGFIVADPAEAYVLETVGRDWVWRQVEDRRALSNAYSIADEYDALSPGLARAGRYDVAASLIDAARDAVSFGRGRCARGQALLDRAAPALAPATMRAILRDHGDVPDWSPAHTRDRTICMHASCGAAQPVLASMVSELWPDRAVHWVTGTSAPCVSLFKPFVRPRRRPSGRRRPTGRTRRRSGGGTRRCIAPPWPTSPPRWPPSRPSATRWRPGSRRGSTPRPRARPWTPPSPPAGPRPKRRRRAGAGPWRRRSGSRPAIARVGRA